MRALRKALVAATALVLPSFALRPILRLLGHQLGPGARIGFSVIWVDRMYLGANTRIGHLNLLRARRLVMRQGAQIGRLNVVFGPLSLLLKDKARIGNSNKIVRAPQNIVTVGPASLRLAAITRFSSNHYLDCTRSISFGPHSQLAGAGTQIWTHGYVHDQSGPGRYRIDGPVYIGSNVYIGSRCVISMGVSIASGAIVGAGTTVSRSLNEAGLYVSAGLRNLPRPAPPDTRADLVRCHGEQLTEVVYRKAGKLSDE